MEFLKIYLNTFKNFRDYKNPSQRKEFNLFVIFTYLINFVISFVAVSFIVPGLDDIGKGQYTLILLNVLLVLYLLIHLVFGVSFLALIKRRLIDIFSNKANVIFWILLPILLLLVATIVFLRITA